MTPVEHRGVMIPDSFARKLGLIPRDNNNTVPSPDQISPEILDKLKKLLEASSEPPQPVKQDSAPQPPKLSIPVLKKNY